MCQDPMMIEEEDQNDLSVDRIRMLEATIKALEERVSALELGYVDAVSKFS